MGHRSCKVSPNQRQRLVMQWPLQLPLQVRGDCCHRCWTWINNHDLLQGDTLCAAFIKRYSKVYQFLEIWNCWNLRAKLSCFSFWMILFLPNCHTVSTSWTGNYTENYLWRSLFLISTIALLYSGWYWRRLVRRKKNIQHLNAENQLPLFVMRRIRK